MKTIFIYTPFWNYSKFIPHLLEHVLLSPKNNLFNYFKFLPLEDVYVKGFLTVIYSLKGDEEFIESIISSIKAIPNKKDINFEKKVLKDELGSSTFYQLLYEKIGKKYIHPNFNNTRVSKVLYDDIISYHQKFYKEGKIYVFGDANIPKKQVDINILVDNISYIRFKGANNKLITFIISPTNIMVGFFITQIINQWLEYSARFFIGKYRHDSAICFLYDDRVVIVIPDSVIQTLLIIPDDFISLCTKNISSSLEFLDGFHGEYTDFIGACIVKFGFRINKSSECNIINNCGDFLRNKYFIYKTNLITKQ